MGRSDYLVQAGVGFDVDRSGARKSIGIFEGYAAKLNTVATKAAADGFAQTERDYNKSMADIGKSNKAADKELADGTKASAKAAQDAIQTSMPKPLSVKQKKSMGKEKAAEYDKDLKLQLKGMGSSYARYIKEAEALGIKVRKAESGFGTGQSVADFQKKDVEQRKRLINLNKRMVEGDKERLKGMHEETDEWKELNAEIKVQERAGREMVNLNEDLTQQERKHGKITQKNAKEERKAEKTRAVGQKKHLQRLKDISRGLQRVGQLASMTAGKIKSGFQNAFVIGTAAAGAFFYKMQPLVESVMEFEKTIVNANSVFNVTQKELHAVSDSMVKFTLKYGVSAQETATGLYQLASAGLSAAESQEVLQHTMKLAMATQGDHNTLAKLTTQTIMGFGMEMADAEVLTDKFAHSIQKSLIEWQDLASSVKFAMPFFVATGQSIDELLGGLEVLTNRALEAGIAGRGLRQALAQFAKHASDNDSAFARMGISILDAEGNMKALSAIALEAKAAFGDVTDLEALTAMLEDMNVRGATAFALLVQNADEFDSAVKNVANSAGEATVMADIQQESLAMQIQRVKNALMAPFLLADEVGKAEGSLNTFTLRIKELVDEFTQFFIIIGPDGQETYSEHGKALKEFVIAVLDQAVLVVKKLKDVFLDQEAGFTTMTDLVQMSTKPLLLLLNILDRLSPATLKWFVYYKAFTALIPITNIRMIAQQVLQTRALMAMGAKVPIQEVTNRQMLIELGLIEGLTLEQIKLNKVKAEEIALDLASNVQTGEGLAIKAADTVATGIDTTVTMENTSANVLNAWSMGVMAAKMMLFVGVSAAFIKVLDGLGAAIVAFAAVAYLGGISSMFRWYSSMIPFPPAAVAATAVTAAAGMGAIWAGYNAFVGKSQTIAGGGAGGDLPALKFNKERNYDGGGTYLPVYDNGGMSTEHGMAVLQKGETVIPKTQNMLGDGGITLNMGDVYTEDGTDFAEKVAAALPDALRRANNQGAI